MLLLEYMLEDASGMTWHMLTKWVEKKGKNVCASRVFQEFKDDQPVGDGRRLKLT